MPGGEADGFRIERLRADHAPGVLAFERANREWFAASVPDRGEEYFASFADRHRALLAEQDTGDCHFHVVLGDDGEVLGRVNLVDVADGAAELGFRVAARAAGRGLATASVRAVCRLAATGYGLTTLRARAAVANVASHRVLIRTGFTPTGAEVVLADRPGLAYVRDLRDLRDLRDPDPA